MRSVTLLPVTEKTVGPKYDPSTGLGNWDDIRVTIDRVIIHTMVGYAQGADERFNDASSNVSSHYGVLESGEVWHWVDEDKTAYHCGDYPTNQRSIGIEHEDNSQPNGARPDALYTASAKLVRDICLFYNIPIDRAHILKHSEVSDRPTSCPDSLDIDRIVALANNSQPDPFDTCRVDRDLNWNCYVLLLQSLNLTPDPDNKMTQAEQAVAIIKELQQKANTPIVIPTPPVVTPITTPTQPTVTPATPSTPAQPEPPTRQNVLVWVAVTIEKWFSN